MKAVCIVPSAGRGRRLLSKEHKTFVTLGGKPLLYHTLAALSKSGLIDEIVAVVPTGKLNKTARGLKKYGLRKVSSVVKGGRNRFHSVRNGLAKAGDAEIVLIHDGARPFVTEGLVKKVFLAAKRYGAAICATPLKQTLKLADKGLFIADTPKRKFLWEAQTPQAFRKDLIIHAYNKAKDTDATDDAMLVEKLGHKVKIVPGSYANIKITTPEDLALARMLVSSQPYMLPKATCDRVGRHKCRPTRSIRVTTIRRCG